ncbi:hypothetical protein H4582DRAFT_2189900 [Lactarius indigo]|nr:hypothetical protein H4582DRAFT_2189900 [Lactarius indigo]
MSKNRYFMAVITTEVAIQVLICFVGGAAFDVTCIGAREWLFSVGLGCVSLPLGAIIRLTLNKPCERGFKKLKLLPESELPPTTHPDAELVNGTYKPFLRHATPPSPTLVQYMNMGPREVWQRHQCTNTGVAYWSACRGDA